MFSDSKSAQPPASRIQSDQGAANTYQESEDQIRSAIADGRYEDARRLLEGVIRAMPRDWEPIRETEESIIGAFWNEEELLAYKAGHPALSKPLLWVPGSLSKLWWYMGSVEQREGKYSTALICLQNAYEYEPDHPGIWAATGCVLTWQDRFAEALDAYRTGATVRSWTSPHVISEALYGQGVSLGGLRRLEEARDAFARALEFDSENEKARADLACVLHDLREVRKHARDGTARTYVM